MSIILNKLQEELKSNATKDKSLIMSRYFKTGKGEYAENDLFLGINLPTLRLLAKKYFEIQAEDLKKILVSKWHEERLTALLILIIKYNMSRKSSNQSQWVNLYLSHLDYVNNWDLVDCSAPHLLGDYCLSRGADILYHLANEKHLWKNRIAIVSTWKFIKFNQFDDCLAISKHLLGHSHDLIHKAIGWMLREIWKKNKKICEEFLIENYRYMPRTTLRYAIEKMPEERRKWFLHLGNKNG